MAKVIGHQYSGTQIYILQKEEQLKKRAQSKEVDITNQVSISKYYDHSTLLYSLLQTGSPFIATLAQGKKILYLHNLP